MGMMEDMTTTLITGANKGLGYEAARRLLAEGHDVWIGARDAERGRKAAEELGARFLQIDVTSDESVAAAAATLSSESESGLDVLINNAGIAVRMPVSEVTAADMQQTYDTNVFGPVRVTQAFIPLLQSSEAPVIVNVASGLGSEAIVRDPDRTEFHVNALAYCSSKSALVMITTQYAKAYPHIKINVVDPGYTGTDLNSNSGPQTVTEGTDAIVAMASIGADGPTGTFTDRHGVVPW
jgi:NAD(P)-dependent dehydrogenase (short-subunit alcohol dehydrogenase family)